ncbi:MAG TPA: type IV pilin [Methanosarcina sp.]|nr:type IV pilin [Methanosarcina sp.]
MKIFRKNHSAVSETVGTVLLLGIVVIMISFSGAYIFAQKGPDDVPHTRLQEWRDSSGDTIYVKHSGGEPLYTENCEIVLNIKGEKYVYSSEDIFKNLGNESVWRLGEVLTIDAGNIWGINITNNDEIELLVVDTPSKQPIQKARLTKEYETTRPSLRIWITPRGEIIDTSGGYGDIRQIKDKDSETPNDVLYNTKDKDRPCTVYHPSLSKLNSSEYQEFDFDINPLEYGLDPEYTFSNVTLKIVYHSHDVATKQIKVKIYDADEPDGWVNLTEDLPPHTDTFKSEYYDLTNYIQNAEELTCFKVRIEGWAENIQKSVYIDYMALWIE